LPQYTPGHLDRVGRARAELRAGPAGLAIAGAGYDGVGIPICVRSGQTAADEIVDGLGESTP
jgi:oxygen-dependent protoporphyrinogen oxidase